jgi:hypothetical protein
MLRVGHGITEESELTFQQKPGHGLSPASPHGMRDALRRCVGAVRGPKGVVDEELRPKTDLLRPLRIISDILGAEAGVFQEENLSTLHPLDRCVCQGTGGRGAKPDRESEKFLELIGNRTEGQGLVGPTPGPAQMRQQDRFRPCLDQILDRRQSTDEASIVDDDAIFIEREIVIYPNDYDFVGERLRGAVFERLLGHPGSYSRSPM